MKKSIRYLILPFLLFIGCLRAYTPYLYFSQEMIESHIKDYNDEEMDAIKKDLKNIRALAFPEASKPSNKKPLYLATAGAPGSRKTTILENFLQSHPELSSIVYLDPDPRGLKFMINTYYSRSLSAAALARIGDYEDAQKLAYQKWRGASNYITLTLLEEAFRQKRDIAHGTTSTGAHIFDFLSKVKKAGYEITLLLCGAEDPFRFESISYRNHVVRFYQNSPEDAVTKGKLFPEKMVTYFSFADTLYIFWSDSLSFKEKLAAVFKNRKLEIKDEKAYRSFINKYIRDAEALLQQGKSLKSWEELTQIYFNAEDAGM